MFQLLKKSTRPNAVPQQRVLQVNGREMPLTIRQNPRATRITLRIEPGGRALKMTVPHGLRHWEVDEFLERHQGWLMTRLARYGSEIRLRHDGEIAVRGVPHRIVHTGLLRGITETAVVDGCSVLRVSGMEEHVGRRIAAFLKKEARRDMEKLVAAHAARIGRPVRSLTMKDTRSRWGSCSWDGNLSFSWRIVMAPPQVIDYLAAHEVAHLREMNHSAAFWALCGELCPAMDEAKAWLKRHGSQLHAVDFS